MTALAAFQGDYVDVRFVKTRKVCQIVIEIPIERGTDFVASFGAPNPASTVPVALARLDATFTSETKGGKLAQRAGILCNDARFRTFMAERDPELKSAFKRLDADMAATELRSICKVNSRAELDHNAQAARAFEDLEREFKAWEIAA